MATRRLIAASLLSVMAVTPALAHDGHAHLIMGTVTARGDKDVKVKTPSGEVLTIAITEKTAVLRGKQKVTVAEVEVGRRVVVDIGNGEDPLMAREIRVGATRLDQK